MNGKKQIGVGEIGDFSALFEWDVSIVLPGVNDFGPESAWDQFARRSTISSTRSFSIKPLRPTVPRSQPPWPASSTRRNCGGCEAGCRALGYFCVVAGPLEPLRRYGRDGQLRVHWVTRLDLSLGFAGPKRSTRARGLACSQLADFDHQAIRILLQTDANIGGHFRFQIPRE